MIVFNNGYTRETFLQKIRQYNDGTEARTILDVSTLLGTCRYQAENGNRCAIGCFIPDGHDALNFYGDVSNLLENYPDLRDHMPFDSLTTLNSLQEVHDHQRGRPDNVHKRIDMWLDGVNV